MNCVFFFFGKRNSSLMFWWHLSSIVINLVFSQFRSTFTNSWNKKLWVYILLYFYFYSTFPHVNFFSSTRKKFYKQYVLFDLDIFSFLLTFYTRNYIHCDQKSHAFRLLITFLRIYKIFIEEIKKCSKFSLFNTK